MMKLKNIVIIGLLVFSANIAAKNPDFQDDFGRIACACIGYWSKQEDSRKTKDKNENQLQEDSHNRKK